MLIKGKNYTYIIATLCTATYDANKSAIKFNYSLNDFMTAYVLAGNLLGTISYAHKETEIDYIDIFNYLNTPDITSTCNYGAKYNLA